MSKELLPNVSLKMDAFFNEDIKLICLQFMDTEIDLAGMDNFFDRATRDMNDTDQYSLKQLFEDGIRLGVFLSKNEHLIPKI